MKEKDLITIYRAFSNLYGAILDTDAFKIIQHYFPDFTLEEFKKYVCMDCGFDPYEALYNDLKNTKESRRIFDAWELAACWQTRRAKSLCPGTNCGSGPRLWRRRALRRACALSLPPISP